MSISVLILSHNRPQLFKRCLESVILANMYHNVDLEVIVNNDTNDIVELNGEFIQYQYEKSDNLSDIYKSLFDRAKGEYIYYLEDDDVMGVRFFETLSQFDEDIFYFNYSPYKWSMDFVRFFGYAGKNFVNKGHFLKEYDDHNFQFGQICFRKDSLDVNDFPDDNCLQNDFKIFQRLKGTFRSINKILYSQTIDGGDNISFRLLNRDRRWIS